MNTRQPTLILSFTLLVVMLGYGRVGLVRLILHRRTEGVLKSATFKQDATGAWYVTLVSHVELPDVAPPPPAPERAIGIDVGLKDLVVLSDGTRVPTPSPYRRAERRLRRLQRHHSRCQRGARIASGHGRRSPASISRSPTSGGTSCTGSPQA